jgi:sortase A
MVKRILSWSLILAGIVLLAIGGWTVYTGIRSQRKAEEIWTRRERAPIPVPAPKPPSYSRGDFIGRLTIPRLNAEMFLIEGTMKEELLQGPGHLEGTALPGRRGNCVIAGHRDTHFRILKDIEEGDEIVVESAGERHRYQVTQTRVVYPTNTKLIQARPDTALTLVTCFPFYYVGPAPKRFVVQAEKVGASAVLRPPADDPENQAQQEAQQQAGHQREIKGSVAAAINDVARKAAEAYRQAFTQADQDSE